MAVELIQTLDGEERYQCAGCEKPIEPGTEVRVVYDASIDDDGDVELHELAAIAHNYCPIEVGGPDGA